MLILTKFFYHIITVKEGNNMENKNIIIILLVIIVVLAAAIGFVLLNPINAKEPTRLIITSDDEQNEGGELSIKLTDLNKTPISKEIVNIKIEDSNGNVVVDDVVKTNSKGKASLDLDLDGGEYIVNVSYGGNDNFTASNATQKLTIKEEVVAEHSTISNDPGAFYSAQAGRVIYTGEVLDSPGGLHRHLGNNKWEPV